ncbi:methyl-accepting chemotaxis sensory transducer with Cache sensor [Vibrio diazotrophicus]|uniref:Methyl-accepting chemotaxis sensory transducer with Cache sensor n=1 Tax=Vibrio diazotrophicus TaxID=685 RepID=A0A329DVM1_VIBDI|nr:methyl-accepting chemotaxis protein [Vibrio diazotrophicus]RAS54418.1 methyl-accepting chemotaxis sensory transducer with Cache sensor [Vibrio diazotrophicus]
MIFVSLRRISIRARLYLLSGMITLFLLFPLMVMVQDYQSDLIKAKQTQTRHLVENTHSLLNHFYQLQTQRTLSEQQAQDQARQAVAQLRYGEEDYFWMNDLTPTMIMHPFKPQLDGKNLSAVKDPQGKALFVEMANIAREQGEGTVYYMWPKPGSDTDVEKVSYVKLFEPWGWIVGSGVYIDDVNALVWQRLQSVFTGLAIVLVAMLTLAYLIGLSITKPCVATLQAMEDIAKGEGDLTKQLDASGKDELSRIAQAFNQFTHKLRHIVLDIVPVTDGVTGSALELTHVAQNAAGKAMEQQQSVDTVASAMNQLHSSNQEVANAAQNAAIAAQTANEKSQQGRDVINQVSVYMDSLSERLTATDSNTQALAKEIQQVSAVLEVIYGVAEQTNLLALNAAIEAARAGEQGRGFAVVADEVRSLATRTQSSTQQIEQIIAGLQERAHQVSASMDETQLQSKGTQEQAEKAQQALDDIDQQIRQILQLNEHIAEASAQQSLATDEISRNLTLIADHSAQAAIQAEQVTAASEQLQENGQRLTHSFSVFKV